MTRAARQLLLVQLCACLAGCGNDSGQDVAYSSSRKTLGDWAPQARSAEPAPPRATPIVDPEPPDRSSDSDAGNDRDSGAVTGGSGSGAPPGGPVPAADGGAARPARLAFSVLTQVQHLRLKLADPSFDDDARGPKNMGAIWISKPDGTFVRSLEVWRRHKERARHLVAYTDACKCPQPDVIASSTLDMHELHAVTWDMTDRKGERVPEGKYALHIEVADYDVANEDKADPNAKNALLSVEFDTQTAPRQVAVEASEHYQDVKLELFAP